MRVRYQSELAEELYPQFRVGWTVHNEVGPNKDNQQIYYDLGGRNYLLGKEMKLRYQPTKNYRSDSLISYTQQNTTHRESGAAFVDKKYGSQFWLGGTNITVTARNYWEIENEG